MRSLDLPQILYQPFAATGDKNTILNSPSTEDPQRANLQTGFPAITQVPIDNGGIPPERMDFNGLGYLLSSFYFFTQCGGVYTFNQDVSNAIGGYPLGAVLYYTDSDGTMYKVRSLLENNTYNFVTTPSYIDGEHWAYVSENAFGKIYPVGSLYITTQNTDSCPIASLIPNSQWKLVGKDHALWTTDGTNANTTIPAGLPNITGTLIANKDWYGGTKSSGAFTYAAVSTSIPGGLNSGAVAKYTLDASRSSSIYGNSDTVQPQAYRVNVWRRTA